MSRLRSFQIGLQKNVNFILLTTNQMGAWLIRKSQTSNIYSTTIMFICHGLMISGDIIDPLMGPIHRPNSDIQSISKITARTGVLPGEVRFDCAGPVFDEIRDVHLPRWIDEICFQNMEP